MKCLLIVNPKSGQQKIKGKLVDVIEILNRAGWSVNCEVTQQSKDISRIISNHSDCDVVVCTGGDGTLNEVCDALYKLGIKMQVGYIPCGTTNDFANSLHIPLEITAATKKIVSGKSHQRDLGLFNGSVFVYTASFGIFTEASYSAPQEVKNALGNVAYVLEGIKDLTNVKGYKAKITIDQEVIEDEFIYCGVCNSTSIGGILHFKEEEVDHNDGKLELFMIRMPKNVIELNDIVFALINGDFNTKYISLYHGSTIEIEAKEKIPYTLDGEYGNKYEKVNIETIQGGLTYLL